MTSKWDIEHGQWMAEYREQEESEASPAAPCSALRDSAIELWDMATTAAVRSMNGEWSDKRFELQTVRFTEKLREIISQNEREQEREASADPNC